MTPEPSAPPLDVLTDEPVEYNCEAGCDVEFLVGAHPGNVIRIPVHSHKLMGHPVFKAMLEFAEFGLKPKVDDRGDMRMQQIPVEDVDGKAFDNLMKFIYNKPLALQRQTPEMVIETLKAAHKYLIPGLVWLCVQHLSTLISLSSVIWIYASVRYLCNDLDNLEELTRLVADKPIPKPVDSSNCSKEDYSSAGPEIQRLCVWLLSQTLTFIDVHAGSVLQSDELEQLDKQFLEFLVKRDSLDVSELVVFSALIRWAESECKRRHLTLTPQSKRQVLHDLIFSVRFFQMTDLEYRSGPEDSGLLSPEENHIIKNMIVYGRPGFIQGNQTINYELFGLCSNWGQMANARFPRVRKNKRDFDTGEPIAGKKRKWSSFRGMGGKRKNSAGLKKVGGLVKNYCLPCTDSGKRRHTDSQITYQSTPSHQDNNASANANHHHQDKNEYEAGGKVPKKKSTFSKAVYVTVIIFAFFFD